jgi:hypothetical protein
MCISSFVFKLNLQKKMKYKYHLIWPNFQQSHFDPEDGDSMFLWKIDVNLQGHTVSQLRKPKSETITLQHVWVWVWVFLCIQLLLLNKFTSFWQET